MTLEQFNFKPSLKAQYEEEATLKTGKNISVVLLRRNGQTTVHKIINNIVIYNVTFVENERLLKCLKNISKIKWFVYMKQY